MPQVYYDDDADVSILYGKSIGILGYGNMGRPVAWNLRDSRLDIRVGCRERDEMYQRALDDGFPTGLIEDITVQTDIQFMLLPDEIAPQVYQSRIAPHLRNGNTLIFASGYNVAFGFIEPPNFIDVGLLAPRILPEAMRERYLKGESFHSIVAAEQDASGRTWQTVLALAKALGSLKAGALEATMTQEAELDLFLQQAVIPHIYHVFTTAASFLLERGYPSEAVMMELYVSGEFNELMARVEQNGLLHAVTQTTMAAQFGLFNQVEREDSYRLKKAMESILREIRDGTFAREWSKEYNTGYNRLKRLLKEQRSLELWETEQDTIDILKRRD
jgi:ketol-acid reductoisomerase